MFGQTSLGSNTTVSDSASRMFRVEVKGLRQTYRSDKLSYPIRRSGSAFISVPYDRMNEEMQRINRLGGKIVSIQPLAMNGQAAADATAAHQNVDADPSAESSKG
jgi:phycocyanin-associated, rod